VCRSAHFFESAGFFSQNRLVAGEFGITIVVC